MKKEILGEENREKLQRFGEGVLHEVTIMSNYIIPLSPHFRVPMAGWFGA